MHQEHPGTYVSPTSYIVPAIIGSSVPCIPIVHDLIAFLDEPHERRARWIERLTLGRAVKHAAHICTLSDATTKDLRERFPALSPERVTTIGAGPRRAEVAMNTPDNATILCVGTLCPRKNQERLIQAYARLPDALRRTYGLVLAGGHGWQDDGILRLARSTPGVLWANYVTDAEYERLLGSCTIFVLPSLYEGFGLTVLDALQRGTPVLTSDRGSLREVAGDAAVTVDPESIASIAEGLERLLRDSALRLSLRERGPAQARLFSWKKTAEKFILLSC